MWFFKLLLLLTLIASWLPLDSKSEDVVFNSDQIQKEAEKSQDAEEQEENEEMAA